MNPIRHTPDPPSGEYPDSYIQPEPAFPDDSPEGIAEYVWSGIEKRGSDIIWKDDTGQWRDGSKELLKQVTEATMSEEARPAKRLTCPVCGSEDTLVVSNILRRRTSFANFSGLEVPLRKMSRHRDLHMECGRPHCGCEWIEEMPEHER